MEKRHITVVGPDRGRWLVFVGLTRVWSSSTRELAEHKSREIRKSLRILNKAQANEDRAVNRTRRRVRIIRQWDDHEPVVLGQLVTNTSESTVELEIESLWIKFQEEHPNCNTEFIDYLVERGRDFTAIDDDFHDVVVG